MTALKPRHYTLDEKLHYGIPLTDDDFDRAIDEAVQRGIEDEFRYRFDGASPNDIEDVEAFAWTAGKDHAMERFNAQPIWRRLWIAIVGYVLDLD